MKECTCIICNSTNSNSYEEQEKLEVTLEFLREELLYDINSLAYVEGEVMGEENQHAQHLLIDVGQDENVNRATRIINLVHAAAIEMLYPYTKKDAVVETVDDKLWKPDKYQIIMHVPTSFSQTTIHLLSRLIHEFMVYRVLADWLSMTNPQAAKKWYEQVEDIKAQIKKAINHRSKVFTRPLNPSW